MFILQMPCKMNSYLIFTKFTFIHIVYIIIVSIYSYSKLKYVPDQVLWLKLKHGINRL